MLSAVLFGSIGSVADTDLVSYLAYRTAFEALGLERHWTESTYTHILNGDDEELVLAQILGISPTDDAVKDLILRQHRAFRQLIPGNIRLRKGVSGALKFCRAVGVKTAWVTTEAEETLQTVTHGLKQELNATDFDVVTSRNWVFAPKPSPEIYHRALIELNALPGTAIAIEDTQSRQLAALGADLACYLYPGQYAETQRSVMLTRNPLDAVTTEHEIAINTNVSQPAGAVQL